MIGCEIDPNNYTVGNDIKYKANFNDYAFIIYYAEKEKGFIEHPKDNHSRDMFALTDLGREIKNRNGFHNWENFKKGVESVPFENIKWMKETAEATRDAAAAANISANYAKKTYTLIFIYTVLTAFVVFIGILTCNYQRHQNNQTNVHNANKDTTVRIVTDADK